MGLRSDALKAADAVLGRAAVAVLALVGRRAAPAPGTPRPDRVLVIRPGGIGDAVLLYPMLHALRAAWPDARIDVLAESRNSGIFGSNGVVDRVLLYDRPAGLLAALRGRYDVVIDSEQTHYLSAALTCLTRAPVRVGFATNRRRWMFTHRVPYSREVYEVRSFLDLGKVATGKDAAFDPDRPFYPVNPEHADWAERTLAPLAGERIAVIHPGASTPLRRWDSARYREVARRLVERGLAVVVIGSSADRAAAARVIQGFPPERVLNLAGVAHLGQTAAVVSRAALYVSADTGPLHLAYGVGVPTVHLFGPGELVKWAPAGKRYRTVRRDVPCSPCTRYGHTPPCCHGVRCMAELTVEDVDRAVRELLET